MSLETPLVNPNEQYYYQYKGILVIKDSTFFDNLDFKNASFEEIYQSAMLHLNCQRISIKKTIEKDFEKNRYRLNKIIILAHTLALTIITLTGIVWSKWGHPTHRQFMTVFGFLSVAMIASFVGSCNTIYPLKHPEQERYNLTKNQIKLLKSEFCIEFLKREENRSLYPLLLNFDLGHYIALEKASFQSNLNAKNLRPQLLN